MRNFTLSQLRDRCKQRADMVNGSFISDDELDGYINSSIADLYDRLRAAQGEDYFTTPSPTVIYLTSSVANYPLPSDFLSLRNIQESSTGTAGSWFNINRVNFKALQTQTYTDNGYHSYRLTSGSVVLHPTPTASGQIQLWYVPASPQLVSGSDVFDGYNGWEEFVVVDVAIKMLIKEESDTSALQGQRNQLIARIDRMAATRDDANPDTIQDVRGGWSPWSRWGFGRGRGGW